MSLAVTVTLNATPAVWGLPAVVVTLKLAAAPAATEAEPAANAHPTRRKPQSIDAPVVPVVSSNVSDEAKAEDKPKRAGWWQRKGFF